MCFIALSTFAAQSASAAPVVGAAARAIEARSRSVHVFRPHQGTYRGLWPLVAVAPNGQRVIFQTETIIQVEANKITIQRALPGFGMRNVTLSYSEIDLKGFARAKVEMVSPEVSQWYQSMYVDSFGLLNFKVTRPQHAKNANYQNAPDLLVVDQTLQKNIPTAAFYRMENPESIGKLQQLIAASQGGDGSVRTYLVSDALVDQEKNWKFFTNWSPDGQL